MGALGKALFAAVFAALIATALDVAYSLEADPEPPVLKYFTPMTDIVNESSIVKLGSISIVEVHPYDNGTVRVIVRPPTFKEFMIIRNNYFEYNVFVGRRPLPPSEVYRRHVLEFAINATITYILDENNYVKNMPGIGFFPLYSRIPLTPEVVEKLRPSYMGRELKCIEGSCIIYYTLRLPNGTAFSVNALHLAEDIGSPGFDYRWNYLVKADNVVLPLNATHRIELGGLEPCPPTIELLASLPDYDTGADKGVYLLLAIIAVVVAAAVAMLRRRG